nr:MAG TPA: hypothetical protein [Caudoviricetes sp.]
MRPVIWQIQINLYLCTKESDYLKEKFFNFVTSLLPINGNIFAFF